MILSICPSSHTSSSWILLHSVSNYSTGKTFTDPTLATLNSFSNDFVYILIQEDIELDSLGHMERINKYIFHEWP